MEEGNALQEREPAPVLMGEAPGYRTPLEQEIWEQARWKYKWEGFRRIIYTALIAAFFTVMLLDVERNTICSSEEVICLEWEKRDGTPRN